MPAISFRHVTKLFEGNTDRAAVHDVTFDIEQGQLVVLLGPSGCGKTTLMRMVNRLIEPTSGEIWVDGRDVRQVNVTDLRRHIGYVIQQTGLFPHMTVARNVATVPRLLGWDRARTKKRVDDLLELVDLPPDQYRDRYPRQLSGGQQQRVGIARAMAADPAILLMDEPFGAIDAITRKDLQNELVNIQRQVSKTILFVTHDVEEALRLADRIVVMRAGEVVQYDTPLRLLTHPANEFVRALLGAGDVFRQLSLIPVSELMEPSAQVSSASGLTIPADSDIRHALNELVAHGTQELVVVGADGQPVGHLYLERILSAAAHSAALAEIER